MHQEWTTSRSLQHTRRRTNGAVTNIRDDTAKPVHSALVDREHLLVELGSQIASGDEMCKKQFGMPISCRSKGKLPPDGDGKEISTGR